MKVPMLTMSLKKELWEFNKLLFWVPIIMMSLVVIAPLLQLLLLEEYQWQAILRMLRTLTEDPNAMALSQMAFASMSGLFVPFMIVSLLVQLYYFLACLFDERRDLSVYFWRSMPVSDGLTVVVKFVTGAFIIPAIFLLAATAALVLTLVFAVFACMFLAASYDISLWHLWGSIDILSNLALIWLNIIPLALWLFPVFAWLMLASMFANKAAFLWALLPVVIIIVVEAFVVQYFNLSSAFFAQTLMNYFGITEHGISVVYHASSSPQLVPFNMLMSKVNIGGLILGSAFIYLAYWLRVNRSQQ